MLKEYLNKRLIEIRRHHSGGATGEQVIAALTDLTDEVIDQIYQSVLLRGPSGGRWKLEDGFAIVALGGYGRGERSPYSDIDIMFLHRPSLQGEIEKTAGAVLQNLWDVGFQVGHSTRTVHDCVTIGRKDLTVRTSLMEARFLCGSRALFDQFRLRYQRKVIQYQTDLYVQAKIRARESEYEQFGTTIHLLEPHIKKSRGGLRDLHLLRWLAQTRYQTASIDQLKQLGILSKQDHRTLTEAQEFLWRIRNDLHFFAGRCQDSLTFDEQIRLAGNWGYHDAPHLLGVEQFMQKYFDQTTAMAEISGRYLSVMSSKAPWRRLLNHLTRRRVDKYYQLSGDEISILPEFRAEVLGRGERVLSLFHLMQEKAVRMSVETEQLLTDRMDQWAEGHFSDAASHAVFLSILSGTRAIAGTLRNLHRFRILERILPAFKRVRGLMQFNLYHKYTVDEHCLRAVEEAEKISGGGDLPARILGEIRRREILFLGLLLHDLGKGLARDHSEEGAAIALDTARRLKIDPEAGDQLVSLVSRHLSMTHVAFRRDLSDDAVLARYAESVANPETLKILYILTLADVAAVGPGTLTAWKKDLLSELFVKTLERLTGQTPRVAGDDKVKRIRELVQTRLQNRYEPDWLKSQVAAMTHSYLAATPPERIALDLERVHALPPKGVEVYARNDIARNLTEYSIYTFDDITPGIFYKITSVLAAKGLQVLNATITTWSNAVVVDTFQVQDPDFSGPSDPDRLRDVHDEIVLVLTGRRELGHPAHAAMRFRAATPSFPVSAPVQIAVDNATSEKYTLIEVFAPDRTGLLSVIAQTIFELDLSVQAARVATHLDQIVDIFHVVDRAGQKITDPDRILHLKTVLAQQIELFLEAARVQ